MLVALAALPGFAAATPPPVVSLKEMRQAGVVVQQWDMSCAAAALATLLRFQHGLPADEREIAQAMLRQTDPLKVRVRGGFSLLDLKRYTDARGLRGIGYRRLALEDLGRMAPIVVPVDFSGFPHFVVFRGIVADRVVLADPAFGNRSVPVDTFRDRWIGSIGFIAAGPDGRPAAPGALAVRGDPVPAVPAAALRQAIAR